MVCPNGHGKIHPVPYVPPRLDLPVATFVKCELHKFHYKKMYTIAGLPGRFQRWNRESRTPGEVVRARLNRFARWTVVSGGKSVKFVRIEEGK